MTSPTAQYALYSTESCTLYMRRMGRTVMPDTTMHLPLRVVCDQRSLTVECSVHSAGVRCHLCSSKCHVCG